jgi:hypothetical protein
MIKLLIAAAFGIGAALVASAAAAQTNAPGVPPACAGAHERAAALRAEIEKDLAAAARAAAEKSPAAYAAAALLAGDIPLAAWAGLRAAQAAWNGKSVADAGIYLHYLDRKSDAMRFLACAYAMGYRSPHLFEALATVHKGQGRDGEARRAIAEAQRLSPGDPLIDLAAALIQTGKPPPAPRADAKDALGRCTAALEAHSRRVLAVRKQNHERHDRLQNVDYRQKAFAGEPKIHQDLIQGVREGAANARRARDALQHNLAIGQCATAYFVLSGLLLDSFYYVESAFPLVFWADALGLDAQVFVRDLPCGSPGNRCDEPRIDPGNSLLSRAAEDKQYLGRNEASHQYFRDIRACASGDAGCRLRARVRECATNKALLEELFGVRQQRVNTASRNFDNQTRTVVSLAEGEVGAAREFAVGLLADLRKGGPSFSAGAGAKPIDAFEFGVQQINQAYLGTLLQPHLLAGGKVEEFLLQQGRWFAQQRAWVEQSNAGMKQSHDSQCEPVMNELRLEQLEAQYQAYLDHLRERLAWGVDSRVDTKFPCDFSIGPLSGAADLNDLGGGKFGYKVTRGPFSGSGSVAVGDEGLKFSGSAGAKVRGVGVGVDTGGSASAGRGARYGPFAGKADASFTSAVNPWNGREYLGIRIKGSAGFGLGSRGGGAAASCYPSSGEVTVYPRALLEDLGAYLGRKE